MNPRAALKKNAERARRMHELYPFTYTESSAARLRRLHALTREGHKPDPSDSGLGVSR